MYPDACNLCWQLRVQTIQHRSLLLLCSLHLMCLACNIRQLLVQGSQAAVQAICSI